MFAKINTEDQQELGASFNIRSIPTLMIFREKIVIFSQAGALPESALEEIIGKSISKSRQHYLRLKFPKTYTRLIKAGIEEDYTLGYSAQPGFRGGICTPYCFYDLKHESVTNLKIIPFNIMDGTLRYYLQLPPEKAFVEIRKIMQEVKNVGGTFVSVWHNETVNDLGTWKGFREVFEQMNKLGFEWANE